jgi:hypothetical protein
MGDDKIQFGRSDIAAERESWGIDEVVKTSTNKPYIVQGKKLYAVYARVEDKPRAEELATA